MRLIKIIILILLTVSATAQIKPRLFEIGPTAGVNLSYISPTDTNTYKHKPNFGLKGGIFTRLNMGKFSLQPEFIYQAKSSNITKPINGRQAYRYLSTPIMIGYTPIKQIYLEAGYEKSWALNQLKDDPIINKPSGPGMPTDQSIILGTRINLLDMFSLFSISLRYVHGLDNVTKYEHNNLPLNFKNRSVQFSVSYTFSEQYLWSRKYGPKKN